MIEHIWAYLSRFLCGCHLSRCLIGEDKAPVDQYGLSDDELKQKEVIAFHSFMLQVLRYWVEQVFDGHSITGSFQPCLKHKEKVYRL